MTRKKLYEKEVVMIILSEIEKRQCSISKITQKTPYNYGRIYNCVMLLKYSNFIIKECDGEFRLSEKGKVLLNICKEYNQFLFNVQDLEKKFGVSFTS